MGTAIITYSNSKLYPVILPEDAHEDVVVLPPNPPTLPVYVKGTVLGQVTGTTPVNAVQTLTITGTPTGGSFRIQFGGQLSAAIAYNATAATVQTALRAMSSIGSDGVTCSGGAFPGTAVVVTFAGKCAAIEQPLMTAINSLTGGTNAAITPTVTTAGSPGVGLWRPYDDSLSDGTQVARRILSYDTTVNTFGQHTVIGGERGETELSAPAYICGTFSTGDLTGLDANGVADLGRLISGTTSTLSATTTQLRIG